MAAACGQAITSENLGDFAQGTREFASPEDAIRAGNRYLDQSPRSDPLRPAVATHLGALLVRSGRAAEAIKVYELGLKSTATTPKQRLAFLTNLGVLAVYSSDNKLAADKFSQALQVAQGVDPGQKGMLNAWISDLALRSKDDKTASKAALRVLAQVATAPVSPALLSDCQTIYENPVKDLDRVLFAKICSRVASGQDPSDFDPLNISISSYRDFADGYPSIKPFGQFGADIQARLESAPQSTASLRAQTAWTQALHDVDRQRGLEFSAKCVARIKNEGMARDERDAAINLVHEMEALASKNDKKAQAIIHQQLQALNARTIFRAEPSEQPGTPWASSALLWIGGLLVMSALSGWFIMRRAG
jgi:hypothetical protein